MTEVETNLTCPDCGAKLTFSPGEPQTFWGPGTPAEIYCQRCGYDRQPTNDEFAKYIGIVEEPETPEFDKTYWNVYEDLLSEKESEL